LHFKFEPAAAFVNQFATILMKLATWNVNSIKVRLPQLLEWLKARRPERILYFSCDAASLARDLKALHEAYRTTHLHLLDLFPQTMHAEALAVLERKG